MKQKLQIAFLILVTIACIILGINTRNRSAILVTQIATNSEESLSYLVESKENSIIMIDGGSYEESEHLEQILTEKGGIVKGWFVTNLYSQNFGALEKIIQNGKVEIQNIYLTTNPRDWYETHEPDQYAENMEFLDLLSEKSLQVWQVPNRHEILVDNLYITVLNIVNPELTGSYAAFNQSMVIKINNTYKSMIFMGNIAQEAAEKFKDNNLDEIDCDAVQICNNGAQFVPDEIYQKMTPKYLFMPVPKNSNQEKAEKYLQNLGKTLNAEEVYASNKGDITVKIK